MLDITLATEFIPGTNVKGEVAGANWLFLLPHMNLERVVCYGAPALPSLVALARMIGEVVVCADGAALDTIGEQSTQHRLGNVRMIGDTLALPAASVGLAWAASPAALARFGQDPAALAELLRILRPEGYLYLEQPGLIAGRRDQAAVRRLAGALGAPQRFWLTPLGGEMHTAIPAEDRTTTRYFLRYGLTSRSVNLGTLKRAVRAYGQAEPTATGEARVRPSPAAGARPRRGLKAQIKRGARKTLVSVYNQVQHAFDRAEQRLSSSMTFGDLARRYGLLLQRGATTPAQAPPRYLCEIAHAAGVEIDRLRWGLSARGEYSSRKVLLFLFERNEERPQYIVKMTRDPALNLRLENEYRALRRLADTGIGDDQTLPQAMFFGHHNRLAIVGESIIDGVPLEQRSSGTPTCPYMRNAADWLTDLGVATVEREVATPAQAAAALRTLYDRFAQIYPLTPDERRFLGDLLDTLAGSTSDFPLVFQHGDPGTWNIWVAADDRTAFLDWEAAEARGMPLWDLFYFIRTYGAWAGRAANTGDVAKGFAEQFLSASPFNTLMAEVTARYCERLELAPELIEPLFYTCWLHRGLKEATRLTTTMLPRGHYFNVLRACIAQREALAGLFAGNAQVLR